jgi:hypothetical protein
VTALCVTGDAEWSWLCDRATVGYLIVGDSLEHNTLEGADIVIIGLINYPMSH